jgi:DNA-binding CsgD family transcriptional regulator
VLVGRSHERERIDTLLAAARAGSSGVLVLHGEAGIGKSALLAYGRARARGMRQLAMSGVETEAELAFGGLTELLRPVLGDIARLPAPQADALHSALALNAEPANPLAVRVALLTLLALLAETSPVLVTVDDGQWLDQSSMEALAFAARRLTAERVAILATVRGDDPIAIGMTADVRHRLQGLSDDDARTLLADRWQLTGAAADRLVQIAAGNPLALLELPDVIGSPLASDAMQPVPVGPRVTEAFRARLDQLPEPTRIAMGVVAADGVADMREILDAFTTLGLPANALQPAERDHLVTIDGDRVTLRHPLLRSVAYHGLPLPDRRRVHAALADALDRPRDVERGTWHRAAAALGPDDNVARALEDAALAAERRGALPTTAHGYARAASLTVDDDERARRLLAGADAWLAAGHWDLALEQLDRAQAYATDPRLRADIAASTGQLEAYRAGPEKGAQILIEAADVIEPIDPERATRLLTYAVSVAVYALDVDEAVALAGRAVQCGERAGGLNAIAGALARVQADLLAAAPSVRETLAPLAQLADALITSDLADAEHVFGLVVLAEFVLESWDHADQLIDVMIRRARATGRLFLLAFALVFRSELDFRRGRWSAAYTTASTEVWETPLGLPGVGSWLHAVQARIEAGMGLVDESRTHGHAALAAATDTGSYAAMVWARAALGFLELGQERPRAAIEHLEVAAAIVERGRLREPGVVWFAPDLIEAYWRVGDVGAARRALETFAAQADATERVWAKATAARTRGLLATTRDEMEAAFEDALTWHDRLDAPFERARSLLRLGERRVGDGRAGAAETPLRDALAVFEQLGARPWAAQARRLLGDSATAPEPIALTRQERQVASLVGRGATNREAAEELFLSARTIDFHLRNIYKKLGIRSRTELAVKLAAQEAQ